MRRFRFYGFVAFMALLLVGCANQNPQPTAVATIVEQPSPTIAAAPAIAAALPPTLTATRPVPTATRVPAIATPNPAVFSYLWPAYIPDGMQISSKESRVARDGEIGAGAPGFFLVTFNGDGGKQKLIIGGGAVEPLPLAGDERAMTLLGRSATLVTSGEQRLVRFKSITGQGSLFLFAIGVSEKDLLLVTESLLPTDQADMRKQAGLK